MFFIYFPVALILSIFVYIDSEKEKMPRWWAAVIFFAPITIIYYIIKTRREKSLIPLAILIFVFIAVGIGESFLYSRIKDKIIYSQLSPTAKEVLKLTEQLKYSITQLNYMTLEIDNLSSVDSSTKKIDEAYTLVDTMKSIFDENDKMIKKFILIVNDYRNLLLEENFDWLLKIEEYYKEPIVIKYLGHLSNYLNNFSSLLKYTGENFNEISNRSPVYLKNYDGYYMNYVRSLESYSLIDVSRMQYQHNFLVHNPELEPYLPTILQKRFVNIWKKK
ncbi:MAG: hypothetical protein HQK69_00675 [Desulfamplus sp.]|nr:hypothetical protein [Desulfamplus sp.]